MLDEGALSSVGRGASVKLQRPAVSWKEEKMHLAKGNKMFGCFDGKETRQVSEPEVMGLGMALAPLSA